MQQQESTIRCRINYEAPLAISLRPRKDPDMSKRYARIHTLTFIMSLLTWWMAYILNIKIDFVPVIIATPIVAAASMIQTFCWKAYMRRDMELDYSFKEIVHALPADALIELINERTDISCAKKETSTSTK